MDCKDFYICLIVEVKKTSINKLFVVVVIEPSKSKLYHPKQSCDYSILLFSILCVPSIHASWVLPPAGIHQTKGPARGIWEPWKKRKGWMGEGKGDSEKKGVENTLKKTRENMVNKGCPSCGRKTVWKQSLAPEARRPLIHSHSTYSHPQSSPDLLRLTFSECQGMLLQLWTKKSN